MTRQQSIHVLAEGVAVGPAGTPIKDLVAAIDLDANRVPVGRLNGITAAPGTLLGPDAAGQWYVALRSDDQGVQVGYATTHDIDNAKARHAVGGSPRSLPEFNIWSAR